MPKATTLDHIPLSELAGVGPRTAEKLQRLGLDNAQDLLFHLPIRYQDRTRITPIGALKEGMEVLIEGNIAASDIVLGRRRSLLCKLEDGSGITSLRFFYFNHTQRGQLKRGNKVRCFGEVRRGSTGLELYHPEYTLASRGELPLLEQQLTPIYPTTEGISQAKLRQLVRQALALVIEQDKYPEALPELLPTDGRYAGTSITEALLFNHNPPLSQISGDDLGLLAQGKHPTQQKLAFEELVAHHLSMLQARRKVRRQDAPALNVNPRLRDRFIANLPFDLTRAQRRAYNEISQDLAQPAPMLRLLQGDVGSGKTLVAALAAVQAVAAGYQVALMVPTEILAEQHHRNFQSWFKPLAIGTEFLHGKLTAKQKQNCLVQIEAGEVPLVVGTHALFQKDVSFNRLGLVIIDEQHRFGVHQRLSLNEKSTSTQVPHQLVMTATPIPRTLAMCAYADLDSSIIDELPPGRTPVETVLVRSERRSEVIERVREACSEGRQAYWVCTLIEESEALQCQAAQATMESLEATLPELSVGLVHGRLKAAEKSEVMANFKSGQLDLLVATTVIEVGVDVPNASLMIIENPERLGLAQLHQLRGRVGRGNRQSYCVLLYQPPLSQPGKQRLTAMRDSNDGFVIAEKDLQLRGPGEFLGTKQAGIMQYKIADFARDAHLLPAIQNCAARLLESSPLSAQQLIRRWLGGKQNYAKV